MQLTKLIFPKTHLFVFLNAHPFVLKIMLPADEAMIPYLFTLGPDGQIDALLFLSKQIPVETVSAFFGAAVRRFAE